MTTIMEDVVDRGTGNAAQIERLHVAGKTGTASKLVDGRYSRPSTTPRSSGSCRRASPAVTIVVVIDSPHRQRVLGGMVAAPIFKRIAEATLRHLGIGPTINPAPPVLVARRDRRNVRARAADACRDERRPARRPRPRRAMPDLQG